MMFSSYKNRERLCVSIYICEHGCEISENDIDFRPKKEFSFHSIYRYIVSNLMITLKSILIINKKNRLIIPRQRQR